MEPLRISVGDVRLTRVPYADVLVDAAIVGLTPSQVASVPWAQPRWAEGSDVRVAAAVWALESDGARVVVDPAQAADSILRTGPDAGAHQRAIASALAGAGVPRESVDLVVASHIDGIGMIAWVDDGEWSPFFPHARVLVSHREIEAIEDADPYAPEGGDALLALDRQGVVTRCGDHETIATGVRVRWTGGHAPGHQVVEIDSRGERAVMLGHLALTPLHCAVPQGAVHGEPQSAWAELARLRDSGALLVAPLWPAPGAGTWNGHAVVPVDDGEISAA